MSLAPSARGFRSAPDERSHDRGRRSPAGPERAPLSGQYPREPPSVREASPRRDLPLPLEQFDRSLALTREQAQISDSIPSGKRFHTFGRGSDSIQLPAMLGGEDRMTAPVAFVNVSWGLIKTWIRPDAIDETPPCRVPFSGFNRISCRGSVGTRLRCSSCRRNTAAISSARMAAAASSRHGPA
jgi:hypothetical protein